MPGDGVVCGSGELLNGYRVSVREDENISGDGWWGRLHNMNVLNATEQYTLKMIKMVHKKKIAFRTCYGTLHIKSNCLHILFMDLF